jgi:hypothetical protein
MQEQVKDHIQVRNTSSLWWTPPLGLAKVGAAVICKIRSIKALYKIRANAKKKKTKAKAGHFFLKRIRERYCKRWGMWLACFNCHSICYHYMILFNYRKYILIITPKLTTLSVQSNSTRYFLAYDDKGHAAVLSCRAIHVIWFATMSWRTRIFTKF